MAKKQTKKRAMVPYSEVQDDVAAKRGRNVSQGRMEQIDELHGLINSMPGYGKIPHPLKKEKAKAKSTKRKARRRK